MRTTPIYPPLSRKSWTPSDGRIYAYILPDAMKIVKVRRVGNSNVISIPREFEVLGFTQDAAVIVTALPSGELRVLPAARVRRLIRAHGRKVVLEDRKALQILEDHDRDRD
jgi:antitoxin component of MazEF toxin-antitoxin module